MMEAGAVEEVQNLAARRLDPALPAMRAHGVPGLIGWLRGEVTARRRSSAARPTRATTPSASSPSRATNCPIFRWAASSEEAAGLLEAGRD